MRKLSTILGLIILLSSFTVFSQTAGVFFSEYLEGTSSNPYNRALEIYNGTGSELDMSSFLIKSGYSGNNNEWNSTYYFFPEGTVLEPGAVWVIANNGAVDSILNVADDVVQYNASGYVVAFSGDDARGLFQVVGSDTVLIDIIGVHGELPPNGAHGWDVAGVPEATQNHTLVRKSSVTEGCTDWAVSAGTTADNSQWIVYPNDTFTYLGWHEGPDAVNGEESVPDNFTLLQNYPNPITKESGANSVTTIDFIIPNTLSDSQCELSVFNLLGQKVSTLFSGRKSAGNYSINFNISNLPAGLYFYQLKSGKFSVVKKMVIVK